MSAAVLPSGAEGKREDREVTAGQAMKLRRVMRRYRLANTPPGSGNTCAKANCGRKISRPSCFATSSSGLKACRN